MQAVPSDSWILTAKNVLINLFSILIYATPEERTCDFDGCRDRIYT